jgi:hypothetical protein
MDSMSVSSNKSEMQQEPTTVCMSYEILDRMERAVMNVRERLLRSTSALDKAGISYAVVGGNAVASWVSTVDRGAVRNTRDVDLLVRRDNLPEITDALRQAGFICETTLGVILFRDGEEGIPSEAIHLLFSGEKTKPDHLLPAPPIETVKDQAGFHVLKLDLLVLMKLLSNRRKDQVHLDDLAAQALIDQTWPAKYPPELATRLQHVLDTPDG